MLISILVPIYNERENIPLLRESLLNTLEKMQAEFEVILVNDGSRDGSTELLDDLARLDSRFKVVHFKRNFGQTAALMAAIDYASGDILIPMDGDLQNDPADIPKLVETLEEGYDVVSGWRKNRQDKALTRTFPSRVANWLISRISGVSLHDYGCTLKAYRSSILEDVRLYGEMHRFVPIYAHWQGARITDIVVNHHARRFGESKYGLGRIFKVSLDLILIRFLENALDRPMHYFGKIGLFSIFFSILSGLLALGLRLFDGVSFVQTPLPLLTVFLMLSGILFIMLGLIAELQMRIYYESQSRRHYSVREARNFEGSPPPRGQKREDA